MTERPNQFKLEQHAPIETIDLCTPTTVTVMQEMIDRRMKILAYYPMTQSDHQIAPLLANVPPEQLTPVELRRRQPGTSPSTIRLIDQNATIPSFWR